MITLSLLGNACSSQDCAEISTKLLGLNAYLRFQRISFSEMVITSLSLLMKADNPQYVSVGLLSLKLFSTKLAHTLIDGCAHIY